MIPDLREGHRAPRIDHPSAGLGCDSYASPTGRCTPYGAEYESKNEKEIE